MKKIKNFKLKIETFLGQLEIRSIRNYNLGFSVIEVILATALFMILSTASITTILQGLSSNRLGKEQTVANQYAAEGIEAVRSIRNQGFSNLTAVNPTPRAVNPIGGVWAFGADGTSNTNAFSPVGKYTRVIKVEDAQRDCSLNIVGSDGSIDPLTKKITSTVSWNFTPSRANSVQLTTYLTDWRKTIPAPGTLGGGMLVYGDGGTTSDAFKYRILDPTTGIWGTAGTIDFDTSASNKAVRALRIYSSAARTEKIVLSRHLAGSNAQSIWVHVWNGTSFASTQLSSWTSTTGTDVRNFDGDYLSNGNFLAVYSDNTSAMKYRIWDGQCWSAQANLVDLSVNGSGIPLYITAKIRPGSNEMMVVSYGVARDTNTQYFNGTGWTLHPRHASTGPASQEMIDFVWSPQNLLKGMLIYNIAASGTNSRIIYTKIFTSNGSGGGSWSGQVSSPTTGATLGSISNDGRKGAEEFIACSKNTADDIYCYRSNSTPTWSTPTNNIITTATDNGIQRSFDFAFEASTGTNGLNVYSDTTAVPKLKKFTSSTNTFDAAATNLSSVSTVLESVRLRPAPNSDDVMILLGNTTDRVFTVLWNGTSNTVYTTPAGKAFTTHQTTTNGSADTDFYYDFAWDKF